MSLLRKLDDIEGEAGLGAILLLLLATIFIATPLTSTGVLSLNFIEFLRFALAAITVIVVAQTVRVRVAVAIAFLATVLASMHWHVSESAATVEAIKLGISLAFDIVVAGVVTGVAFGSGRVTVFRILGAVILYLYVALVFAGLFRLEALILPNAFSNLPGEANRRFGALLTFSLGSLTTNGGGDVGALHPLARSLANLEAVIGQLFPATLLARLVTLHAAGVGQEGEEDR